MSDQQSDPVLSLYQTIPRTEVAQMRATIEQQAAEIAAAEQRGFIRGLNAENKAARELAALKAQPRSAVVLPEPKVLDNGHSDGFVAGFNVCLAETELINQPGECVAVPRELLASLGGALAYQDPETPDENRLYAVSALIAGRAYNSICRMLGGRWPDARLEQEAPEAHAFFMALIAQQGNPEKRGCTKPGCFPYCDCGSVDDAQQGKAVQS